MSVPPQLQRWAKWLGLFFLGASASGQSREEAAQVDEPRWLSYRVLEKYVGTELEYERESRQLVGSQSPTVRDRMMIAPVVGVSLDGSIYHPNLAYLRVDGEGGPNWESIDFKSPNGQTTEQDQFGWLVRGHSSLTLLREKPYATRLFADNAHIYRDYDFFNHATVDRLTYGASSGYSAGPVPFSVTYSRIEEDITGSLQAARLDQDTLNFNALNEREKGTTRFSYTLDSYRSTEEGTVGQDAVNNTLDLSDIERMGAGEWITLHSRIYFNDLNTTISDSSTFMAQEQATLQLRENLANTYDYSFDRQATDDVVSQTHQGRAGLRHQLYESLTSMIDVHTEASDTEGLGAESGFTRYGISLSENYTKRLGGWGRLTLGDTVRADTENRYSGGSVAFVVAEPHNLTQNRFVFLNQANVVPGSVAVRGVDVNGVFRTFTAGLHYTVQQFGLMTGIQRIPGDPLGIPEDGAVLVDYQVSNQGSDNFRTVFNQAYIRLDLWNNRVGIYGRLNTIDNYGGEALSLQELTDLIVGVDMNWRWFRFGAEYEDYDSNLAPFSAYRLFQNFSIDPAPDMTLGIDFSESWTKYPDVGRDLTIYQIIARYRWAITPALSWFAEGGMRFQRGRGFEQDLATVRTGFNFRYGQFSFQAGYEYSDEDYLGELRERHLAFLRARRYF